MAAKREWAEQRIRELAGAAEITCLATGPRLPDDAAWQRRLNRHRHRRPEHWRLLEASSLSSVSQLLMQGSDCHEDLVLLDSLVGLWPQDWSSMRSAGWSCRPPLSWLWPTDFTPVVLVAEEVGWGVVPPTAIGGRFRDRNGSFTRMCEQHCAESWLVTAGRALALASTGAPFNTSTT